MAIAAESRAQPQAFRAGPPERRADARRSLRPLREREFGLITSLIRTECGIALSSAKKALVEGRLKRRLQNLGLQTYYDYYLLLAEDDGTERQEMLNLITTNETSFFREPAHFEWIEQSLVPKWRRDAADGRGERRIRVWSAGCSTGEEPYSLAMCLRRALPAAEGWRFEIVATDISTRALEQAASGIYSFERARSIPIGYRNRFVLRGRGAQAGKVKICPSLREHVRFGRFNLHRRRYAFSGSFDLILCRNVLIYFGRDERMAVVDRFLDLLSPGGILMLGHAESLQGESDRVRCVFPTVYSLVGTRPGERRDALGGEPR